jgi:ribokinase
MMSYLVSGNINIETTAHIETFPIHYQPTTFVPFGVSSRVSAVGYNLAKALMVLGNRVALLSITGQDLAARTIRATLAADGISDHYVLGMLEQSPQSIVLYDADGRRHVFTDLKNVLEQTIPTDVFDQALDTCEVALLTNIAYNRPLAARAKNRGKLVATDIQTIADLDDAYNRPFFEAADVLFMSGERLPIPPDEWARQVLRRYGTQIVGIGLGAQGALLARRDTHTQIHVPAVTTRPVVSTGGAGDALFAAFMHSYAASGDADAAIRRAVLFASYKIGAAGSSEGFLDQHGLEQLVAGSA